MQHGFWNGFGCGFFIGLWLLVYGKFTPDEFSVVSVIFLIAVFAIDGAFIGAILGGLADEKKKIGSVHAP